MSIAVPVRFEYANVNAATIAASPAWTAITAAAARPIAQMRVQASTGAGTSYEISFDGVNAAFFVVANAPLFVDFRANNLLLPAGTIVYARSTGAAPVGLFSVSLVEESIQSRGG